MTKICPRCGRARYTTPHANNCDQIKKVVVKHDSYGCDSGCCGHRIIACGENGEMVEEDFDFTHPYDESPKIFALSLADRHYPGVELGWEECEIFDH